jgi:PDZ domain-containing secreted protein
MKYIKANYKFILFIILIVILFSIKFPCYIDAPGGISNMENKIILDGYKSTGSLNITYVKEYRATIPTLFVSFF